MSPVLYGRGPLGRDTRTSEGEALACVEALFAKTHATWNVTCGESLEYSVSQQSLLRVAATSHCELIDQASRWIPESLRALWRVVVLGMGSCCAAHIYANCKHWNGIVCQLMEAFPSTVRYFKSFEVLLGYRTSLHDSRTALKGWGAFRPVLAAPHAKYLDTIAKVVEDLVFKPASECFDLDTFLADRGNYLVDGSAGRGAESVTLRDGTRVTFRRKCDAYCVKTSKQLQALTRSTGAAAKVMPKVDERGKSRAIVGYPNSSYLRCSWLTHCIDMGRSFVYSPLEKGQKWLTDLANTLSKLEGTRWAIDQSSFDEHQHPLYVTHALRCVLEKCVEALGSCPEAVELCRLELEDFATKVFVDPRGRVLARGVPFLPSGHRLTSMLGTILNRASFLLVKELAELDGPSWHMGDDILYVGTGNWERIRSSYSYLGLEVNRSKSLISADVGEFLRMLFGRHTVMTYPVRILSSILWISPQSQAGFQNRVRGVSDLLRKGKVRGLVVPSAFWPCYISKCAPRGQKAMYTRFVRSPLCVGGLGWGWVKVFAIPKVRTDYVGIYRAIGIESECGWALARSAASLPAFARYTRVEWKTGHSPNPDKVHSELPSYVPDVPPPVNPVPSAKDGAGWWLAAQGLDAWLMRLRTRWRGEFSSCLSAGYRYRNPKATIRSVARAVRTLGLSPMVICSFWNFAETFPEFWRSWKNWSALCRPTLRGPNPKAITDLKLWSSLNMDETENVIFLT